VQILGAHKLHPRVSANLVGKDGEEVRKNPQMDVVNKRKATGKVGEMCLCKTAITIDGLGKKYDQMREKEVGVQAIRIQDFPSHKKRNGLGRGRANLSKFNAGGTKT